MTYQRPRSTCRHPARALLGGFIAILLAATSTLAQGSATAANKRFALLIGNQAYAARVGALKNPHNDVDLIAATLASIGFHKDNVRVVHDADRVSLLRTIDAFADKVAAAGPNAIAFFYYSGHGAASNRDNRNYLIPTGIAALDRNVWYQAVALDDIVTKLADRAPDAAHFVIFDACRNLLRMPTKGRKGFVPVAERRGMLIAFSTDPGQTASDEGTGAGPYAAALARELAKPGQHHLDLFQNVKEQVFRKTGTQVPWERNGLLQRIYLAGTARSETTTASPAPAAERAWSALGETRDKAVLEAFIANYPKSFYAVLARRRLASLSPTPKTTPSSPGTQPTTHSTTPDDGATIGNFAQRRPDGGLVLTAPKWAGAKGFRRISKKEAEARLAGYTVVYGNGSREFHSPDGKTKIWRKRRNAYSYGNWSVSSTGRLSYRYGSRQGCWGYILYNAETQKFRVDWRKANCKYGFARFIVGEHLK